MADIHLTLAMDEYDHTRDLLQGRVKAEGIKLTWLNLDVEEIFFRFASAFEWDVSELSFAKYCALMSQPDPPIVGIPVMVSRVFPPLRLVRQDRRPGPDPGRPCRQADRHPGMVANRDRLCARLACARCRHPARCGGVGAGRGSTSRGRIELAHLKLPENIRYRQVADRALGEMLIAGEIDALISARPPRRFLDGDPGIKRLIAEYRSAEEAYFKRTGIYPIMHTVAIKRQTYERYPWIAMNLLNGFEEAKRRSLERLRSLTHSQIPVPWIYDTVARLGAEIFPGGDYWPYGIEPNRTTIEAFLQYCFEQGLCHRKLAPEDLYPREVQSAFRV